MVPVLRLSKKRIMEKATINQDEKSIMVTFRMKEKNFSEVLKAARKNHQNKSDFLRTIINNSLKNGRS